MCEGSHRSHELVGLKNDTWAASGARGGGATLVGASWGDLGPSWGEIGWCLGDFFGTSIFLNYWSDLGGKKGTQRET